MGRIVAYNESSETVIVLWQNGTKNSIEYRFLSPKMQAIAAALNGETGSGVVGGIANAFTLMSVEFDVKYLPKKPVAGQRYSIVTAVGLFIPGTNLSKPDEAAYGVLGLKMNNMDYALLQGKTIEMPIPNVPHMLKGGATSGAGDVPAEAQGQINGVTSRKGLDVVVVIGVANSAGVLVDAMAVVYQVRAPDLTARGPGKITWASLEQRTSSFSTDRTVSNFWVMTRKRLLVFLRRLKRF